MYTPPEVSTQVSVDIVDRWLRRGCEALLTNWDSESGNFWRDSWRTSADTAEDETETTRALGPGKGATSNNRAFQALVGAAYFLLENEGGGSSLQSGVTDAVRRMIEGYYTGDLESIRGHGENRLNPYTDAQLLLSLALAVSPVTASTCGVSLSDHQSDRLMDHLRVLVGKVSGRLTAEGVRVHESARPHHFLTLHSVRALDAAKRALEGLGDTDAASVADIGRLREYGPLLDDVRDEIVRQLGLHLLPSPGFDSSSLVSCCSLLARFTGDAESPLLQQAVDALVADQSHRGTWTSAGVLSFGRRRLVYIPSVELSLVLSSLALLDLHEGDTNVFDRAIPALDASLNLVQSSYSRHMDAAGWRNDRTLAGDEIESWTTAVVVQFLIAYREALTVARQEQILRKYRASRKPPQFSSFWADLARLVPTAEQQAVLRVGELPPKRLSRFRALNDPTAENSIVESIRAEILEPTLTSVSERPVDTASFLLFGPPGTRKTSLVEAMAAALDWPLITLSPPVFLRSGIEGFEAAADEIFEDLFHLKRVVVLFDECEDFFRWRPHPTSIESRTIGAFITSGMLPRLQRLRQTRWIVFAINTNVEAFELDDAVTRRGRLDKAARVGHPELSAQLRYLVGWRSRRSGKSLDSHHLKWFTDHLQRVDADTREIRVGLDAEREKAQREHPDRGSKYRDRMTQINEEAATLLRKVVTFGTLDNLAERCLGEGHDAPIESSDALSRNLDQEFQRFGPDSWVAH